MYLLFRPLLFLLPAEAAHLLGMFFLRQLGRLGFLVEWLRARTLRKGGVIEVLGPVQRPEPQRDLSVRLGTLKLVHPVALAAGLDKDGEALDGLFALGFSAVEVGTVTPLPQPGNPRPRLFRIPQQRALINRMGFNNHGMDAMARSLQRQAWRPGLVGVNIGKNKDTPLADATADYLRSVDRLARLADYVVVNLSSPNTPGLRQLQQPEHLSALLKAVRERMDVVAPGRSLFMKFAPDLSPEDIDTLVDVAVAERLEGLVATNTTLARPSPGPLSGEAGGLSGAPLKALSTQALRRAAQRAQGRLALVGVGGIFTPEDVYEKLRAGASVVQLYTGLIYNGPGVVSDLLRGLSALLARDGLSRLQDAVGRDVAARPETVKGQSNPS